MAEIQDRKSQQQFAEQQTQSNANKMVLIVGNLSVFGLNLASGGINFPVLYVYIGFLLLKQLSQARSIAACLWNTNQDFMTLCFIHWMFGASIIINKTGILQSALIGTVLLRESDPNSTCLSNFKFSLLWANKENDQSQIQFVRSKNQMILIQLVVTFLMSVLQLMDWNVLYFPHWTIQGSFVGNTLAVLLVTLVLTKSKAK